MATFDVRDPNYELAGAFEGTLSDARRVAGALSSNGWHLTFLGEDVEGFWAKPGIGPRTHAYFTNEAWPCICGGQEHRTENMECLFRTDEED